MVDHLMPAAGLGVLMWFQGRHVLLEFADQVFLGGMIVRPVAQGPGEAERWKAVASPPRGFAQRRMPVDAVTPQAQLAHRSEVCGRSVEIFALAGQLAGGREDWPRHEYSIAHFIVIGHGGEWIAVLAENLIGSASAQERPASAVFS